jgi:hypothetical protein
LSNDIAAYQYIGIGESAIKRLPLGKYVIGDNTYICTEHILTPFSGPEKFEPGKDAYNFFLSQC